MSDKFTVNVNSTIIFANKEKRITTQTLLLEGYSLQTAHVQQKSDADEIADSWGITYYKMVLEVVTVFDNFKTVLLMCLVILMKKIRFYIINDFY